MDEHDCRMWAVSQAFHIIQRCRADDGKGIDLDVVETLAERLFAFAACGDFNTSYMPSQGFGYNVGAYQAPGRRNDG